MSLSALNSWGSATSKRTRNCSKPRTPCKQVKGGAEPDPTEDWIEHIAWLTYLTHFKKAHWQKVVPDFDVLELHVKRLRWVLSYWLSSHCTSNEYPVPVPDYTALGYVKAGEGDGEVALMLMRRQPWVTLMPGQGIHEVRCRCPVMDGKSLCKGCICVQYGKCSVLCNCRGICGNGEGSNGAGGVDALISSVGGEERENKESDLLDGSDKDMSDSEPDDEEPLDGGYMAGELRSHGFDKDSALEYAQDVAREAEQMQRELPPGEYRV